MADSRNEDHDKVSAECGSEFFFEHICQPCSTVSVLEAIGFCVDCREWLCKECYKCHRRPTPMRSHQLMDVGQMKSNMPSATGKDRCTQTCEQHGGKKHKYFCSVHHAFGCSMCIIQSHMGCTVDSIQDLARDIFNKSEFTDLMDRFNNVISSTKATDIDVKQHSSQTAKKHTEAIEAIKTFRQELNDALDEIEKYLKTKCSIHKETEIKKLESINEKCQAVQTQSRAIVKKIDDLKAINQNCDAFVAMKQASTEIKPLENQVQEARASIRSSNYTFKSNRDILKTLRSVGGIGTLIDDGEYDEMYYSNLIAEHVKDIPLGKIGRISGFALLSPSKLVVVECGNKQVTIVDTDKDRRHSDIEIDGRPWSVAVINGTTFAVTVNGNNSKILILKLLSSGKLSEEKSITVSGNCYGIAFNNNTFVVTFLYPDRIKLLDMTGSVLRTLASSEHEPSGILSFPQNVSLSLDKQSMYVSNFDNDTIALLRLDGTVVAKYRDSELRSPEQAAVDEHGMVYISAWGSSNVHLMTPNCKKVKVILTEADGLQQAMSISYCDRRHRLYIGMDNCDKVKVFQLK